MLTKTEKTIIPNEQSKSDDTKIPEKETNNIPEDTTVNSNNDESTGANANNNTTTSDSTKESATTINTDANETTTTKTNEIVDMKTNEITDTNRDSNIDDVDIISPKEDSLLTAELSTSPKFTTVIPEEVKQKIETEVTGARETLGPTTETAETTETTETAQTTEVKASKQKTQKKIYTDFYEFPKINSNLRGITYLGEDFFLEHLTRLDGKDGVIKHLNRFVDSLLQVKKVISMDFITVRFIICEYTFMGIFFQLLNFKRSDNIFLQPDSFNNILLITKKILDRISLKIATLFGRILSNEKEYDLLQYVVILGQTFYQKQENQTEENKYTQIMSKQLGQHHIFQDYKTWEKLIEYHIKKQKKNLKKLKQRITKEREKTIAINTIVTYMFNMRNFGVDETCLDNIKRFAERNEIPKDLIESKFD